jgi:hypothetical protein
MKGECGRADTEVVSRERGAAKDDAVSIEGDDEERFGLRQTNLAAGTSRFLKTRQGRKGEG